LPEVSKLSPLVNRILGRNPSPFTLTGTNMYLVGSGQGRILIDAGEGKPGVLQDLLRAMEDEGCSHLEQIVITHWHHDHLLGVPELLRHFGSHVPVRKYLPPEGTAAGERGPGDLGGGWSPDKLLHELPVSGLVDGEVLCCEGARLRVLFTPGHANDHVCLFLQEEKALFTGDNVLGWGTGTFQDLQLYMSSLRRMRDEEPERLYPAHGPAIAGKKETADWLQMYISHREERIQQATEALRAGPEAGCDVPSLVRTIYQEQPSVLQSEILFKGACINTKRVLDYLEQEGLCAQLKDGFYVWVPSASRL